MIAICIESSHQRGMGHFYRALNILEYLRGKRELAVILINDNQVAVQILKEKEIQFEIVNYDDISSNWEKDIIDKYRVDVWLLDKFQTKKELAQHVKSEEIILAAIDDSGAGAELVDLHFCSMMFHNLKGKNIYSGKDYLILNPEIANYRHKRTKLEKIIVTLGGSDTYGVTVRVVKILKKYGCTADIVIGPSFQHKKLLEQEINSHFTVYDTVPSLIEKFSEYDLAITGGGVTCFEANASGLPCIIIANEIHEIEIGKYLAGFHGARFAGYYKNIIEEEFLIDNVNIEEMSIAALQAVPLNGMDNIYKVIQNYEEENER